MAVAERGVVAAQGRAAALSLPGWMGLQEREGTDDGKEGEFGKKIEGET